MADGIKHTSISAVLGVNAIAICDCGHKEFRVGLRVKNGNNHIRCLECADCGQQMAVPFFANAIMPKGGAAASSGEKS